MSQSETDRRPARFDVRAAAAAAVMFGVLGGGAESQQAGKPSADGQAREAPADDAPSRKPAVKAARDQDAAGLPRLPNAGTVAPRPPAAPARTRAEAPAAKDAPKAGAKDEPKAAAKKVDEPAAQESDDPAPAPAPAEAPAAPRPASLESLATGAGPLAPEELQAIRGDAEARLKELAPPADGGDGGDADPARKVADKALAEILEARLRKLEDYDKLAAELADGAKPESDPARRIAEAKAEIADLEERYKQPIEELTPPLFRADGPVDQASQEQMREAIGAAKKDVADYQEKLASAPAEPEKEARAPIAALKAERDKVAQNLEAIKARAEALTSEAESKTPAARKMAAERSVDFRVDGSLEALRLQLAERKVSRTSKAAEAQAVDRARWVARVKLARRVLEPMEARFRKIAEAQEHDLQRKAQTEQAKADRERDPIARYRAERQAELLDLEAAVVKAEQAATVSVQPSLEDMTKHAIVAAANFEKIKRLVEGGGKQAGRLDVMSINADYKRLQPERRRIEREERSVVEKRLADYSNLLASVELSQIEDALLDQIDLDDLLDRLPLDRHQEATKAWKELEEKHSALLKKRRAALEQLVRTEADTLDQIDRRLEILEEETSFIRTHLFWVRDQDPIGATTVSLAAGEARRLARVAAGLARATATTSGWKPATPEFLAAGLVVLILPLGIFRGRRSLRRRLEQMLPSPPPPVAPPADVNPVVHQG